MRGTTCDESSPDLVCRIKVAPGESTGAGDRVARPIVSGRLPFEEWQDAFSAVGCPRSDETTIGFGQSLSGRHPTILQGFRKRDP
jgi:hypothetical protein